MKTENVSNQRRNLNVRVRLCHFNHILKIYWAVTLYLKLLLVCLADLKAFAHLNEIWEQVIRLGVDYREGVDWDQDLVALTVDSDRVVVVSVVIQRWSELNVDLLGHASWDHSFLVVPDFEIVGLWWQDVETLWSWRVVNESQLHRVGLVGFEASELDNAWRCFEDAIRADSIIVEFFGDRYSFLGLSFAHNTALNLNLILTFRWLSVHQ